MERVKRLFSEYGIEEFEIVKNKKIGIVIRGRKRSLKGYEWVNLINVVKFILKEDVEFIMGDNVWVNYWSYMPIS